MKSAMLKLLVVVVMVSNVPIYASTVAYWRFEEGPADAAVSHGGMGDGVFYEGTADSSGNGYGLSVWAEGWAGYAYRTDVAGSSASGAANNYSVKNTGGSPAMFTETGAGIQTITPAAFTIEATFKLENGGYKTIVGRDSRGSATVNGDLAALYFQAVPNNGLPSSSAMCRVTGMKRLRPIIHMSVLTGPQRTRMAILLRRGTAWRPSATVRICRCICVMSPKAAIGS